MRACWVVTVVGCANASPVVDDSATTGTSPSQTDAVESPATDTGEPVAPDTSEAVDAVLAIAAVTVTPDAPRPDAMLTCAVRLTGTGAATATATFTWSNQTTGVPLGAGSAIALSGSVEPGDVVRCTATGTSGDVVVAGFGEVTVRAFAPGDTVSSLTLGTLAFVPSGTFTMGCVLDRDDVDGTCPAAETPAHEVTLTRGRWVMEQEVSQAMWASLVPGTNPAYFGPNGNGDDCGETCPVERVNAYEAMAFANAASVRDGLPVCYRLTDCAGVLGVGCASSLKDCPLPDAYTCRSVVLTSGTKDPQDCGGYRLLTEAEWEFAARGGTELKYPGSADPSDVAWGLANAADTTHPSCTLERNAFGLCDMSGNVEEWVWDLDGAYDAAAAVDPRGPASSAERVTRAGAFTSVASDLRAAYRTHSVSERRVRAFGFRLARTAP